MTIPTDNHSPVHLGTGRLTWSTHERTGDRYGAVSLMTDGDSLTQPSSYIEFTDRHAGHRGTLTARIVETRDSTHVGDLFRGFFPSTPDVGDVIELGAGTLFVEREDWAEVVGLRPDDGRDTDWLDPKALYRCHEQTVDLLFTPAGPA